MAYNTPESVADYLSRFQMQVTERTKGTFSPMHVKYSLALKMGSSSFETTFQSNPNVHGEPTVTQVFGALASDAMLARDYGMDEFADEFCADMKPSEAIRAYNSCKDTYNWMRDSLHLSNGDIASLSEVIGENESEVGALVEQWKTELSECDIDPEAVSVDSEAHDMENGRDGLDGNAPEKDAPEKDDRDAQPPVDTDKR